MLIHVGIVGRGAGWPALLRQEGVPHSPVSGDPSGEQFSALVASGDLDHFELERLRRYLADGGGVVCSGRAFAQISGTPGKETFIRSLPGDPQKGFFVPALVDIFAQCEIPAGANSLSSDGGVPSALVGEFGGGHLVVLPFDPAALVHDGRTATKSFYAQTRRLPFERVSLVSKGEMSRLVSRALQILHKRRGLLYAHQSYSPSGRRPVFTFRIDTDHAERPEIERLRDLAHDSNVPLTWFVDAGSQKSFLSLFREMGADEVGIHCFHHTVFRDAAAQSEDIRMAVQEFARARLRAESYAAPFGRWEESAGEAVERFKFCYSSEFCYDYDNLPSAPYVNGRFLSTLQVPVHPISIGGLRRQGFGEDEMIAYFRSVMDRKVCGGEPVLLYHHPKDGHPDVLKEIFRIARERDLQFLRMIDYARWWKGRSCDGWEIKLEAAKVNLRMPPAPEEPWIHFVRPDGMEAFTRAAPTLAIDDLDWQTQPAAPELPGDIMRIRKFNPWIPIIRAEDRLAGLFRG